LGNNILLLTQKFYERNADERLLDQKVSKTTYK